jgi:hypothetical protein
MDYSAWDLETLQARFAESGGELARLENERQALLAEMEGRKRVSSAKVRLSALSESERAALKEALAEDAK